MASKLKQKAAKAAAAASVEPGAYIKQQVVELSVANETKIRTLLQDLQAVQQHLQAFPASSSAAAGLTAKQLQQYYAQLYDQLLEYGFTGDQVQTALAALPTGSADVSNCLDWLCYNVPAQQLPRRFTGSSRLAGGTAGVKVVARAGEGADAAYDDAASTSSDRSQAAATAEAEDDEASDQVDAGAAAPAVAVDDQAAAKAWILQQYMADSDGSEDDGQQQEQQDEDVIEDWELWGDPREIERRRAERAFAALPIAQQQSKLAAEFVAARNWAAAAKAAGDKQKQKEAGQLIGALKAEMKRLSLSENDALAMVGQGGNSGGTIQQQQQRQQQQQQGDDEDDQRSDDDEQRAAAAAAAAAAEKARKKKEKEARKQAKAAADAAAAAAAAEPGATKKKHKSKDKGVDKVKQYKEAKSKKKGEKESKQGGSSSSKKKTKSARDGDEGHNSIPAAATAAAAAATAAAAAPTTESVVTVALQSDSDNDDWAPNVTETLAAVVSNAALAADATTAAAAAAAEEQVEMAANAGQEAAGTEQDVNLAQQQQQCETAAAAPVAAAAAEQPEGSSSSTADTTAAAGQQAQNSTEHTSMAAAAAATAEEPPRDSTAGKQQQQQQQQMAAAVAAAAAAAEEDEFQLPDIFDEAAAGLEGDSTVPAAARKQKAPFTPWGQYSTATKSKSKPKHSKPQQQQPAVELKTPKALLQQHCQKLGWQPPRFERITQSATAAAVGGTAGQYRYKVIIAPASNTGSGKAATSKRFGGLAGPRSYQLFADEDGWQNVQDAQNAAAARALFALHKQAVAAAAAGKGGSSSTAMEQMRAVYEQMERQWALLWDGWWLSEGTDKSGVEEHLLAEQEQQRDNFLKSLLTSEEQQQQQQQQVLQERDAAAAAGTADAAFADAADLAAAAAAAAEVEEEEVDVAAAAAEAQESDSEEAHEWMLAAGLDGDDNTAAAAAAAAATQEAEQQQQQEQQQAAVAAATRRSEQLRRQLLDWRSSPDGQAMQSQRAKLPMSGLRQQIADALARSDAVVVSGETGSGKTTQVPQFLLEDAVLSGHGSACNVIVTQPRRIAAISVAERVAVERGDRGGPGAPGSAVGYHVRLDAAVSNSTQLLFCTTGILLRRLASDPMLSGVTHVVVDEVHERSLQGDVLMALLQRIAAARNAAADAAGVTLGAQQSQQQHLQQPQRLKVILMSATLDAQIYSSYYWGCPVLSCPGRTFPVSVHYLEDCYEATRYVLAPDARAALRAGSAAAAAAAAKRKASARGNAGKAALLAAGWGDEESLQTGALNPYYDPDECATYSERVRKNLARLNEDVLDLDFIEELISWADEETPLPGAILVFLPGMGEISSLMERLSSTSRYNRGKHLLLPLHSAISADQQRAAFKVPPEGVRKIVLSTNIAETSVTLEDVVVVIDSGRHKERRFDPHKRMSLLVEDWVSRAAALQRRGRAGRVRAGTCFCCYTRARFEHTMRQYAVPEVARVPLEELVLQIHLLGLGPAAAFLTRLIQPPPPKAVEAALAGLQEVGAITITPATTTCSTAAAQTAPGNGIGSNKSSSWPVAEGELGPASSSSSGAIAAATADIAGGVEVLTPLGRLLAVLPMEPRLAKLLVMGAALGCLAPALTIAAAFSHKSPFSAPLEKQDELERIKHALAAATATSAGDTSSAAVYPSTLAGLVCDGSSKAAMPPAAVAAASLACGQQSDHLLLVAAFEMWRVTGAVSGDKAAAQVARRHMLSFQALEAMLELRRQFAGLLQEAHLIPHSNDTQQQQQHSRSSRSSSSKWSCWADNAAHPANRFAGRPEVIKAALVSALVPHVAVMTAASAESRPGWLDNRGQQVYLHPSSVLHELTAGQLHHPHVVYLEKTKTTRVFLREVSVASPLALLLLGGSNFEIQYDAGTVLVDGWLQVRTPAATAVLIKRLRQALEHVLTASIAASAVSGRQAQGLVGKEALSVTNLLQQLLVAEVTEAGR